MPHPGIITARRVSSIAYYKPNLKRAKLQLIKHKIKEKADLLTKLLKIRAIIFQKACNLQHINESRHCDVGIH